MNIDIIKYIFKFCDHITSLSLTMLCKDLYEQSDVLFATHAEYNNLCMYKTFKDLWLLIYYERQKDNNYINIITNVSNILKKDYNIDDFAMFLDYSKTDEKVIIFNDILLTLNNMDNLDTMLKSVVTLGGLYNIIYKIAYWKGTCKSCNKVVVIPLSTYCIKCTNKLYKEKGTEHVEIFKELFMSERLNVTQILGFY